MGKMRAAILTSSDSGYAGQREDLSGPAIRELLEKNGYEDVKIFPDTQGILRVVEGTVNN